MTSDLDIYRSANVLIELYGEDAVIEAAMRAADSARPVLGWRSSLYNLSPPSTGLFLLEIQAA